MKDVKGGAEDFKYEVLNTACGEGSTICKLVSSSEEEMGGEGHA